jgi:hypothetical protein
MLAPDADIILAIMHHKQNATYKITCNHILSHQDKKKRKLKEEKEKDRKLKRKEERRQGIQEVDIGEGTHAPSLPPTPPQSPSPSINVISDDDTSIATTTRPNHKLGQEDLSEPTIH